MDIPCNLYKKWSRSPFVRRQRPNAIVSVYINLVFSPSCMGAFSTDHLQLMNYSLSFAISFPELPYLDLVSSLSNPQSSLSSLQQPPQEGVSDYSPSRGSLSCHCYLGRENPREPHQPFHQREDHLVERRSALPEVGSYGLRWVQTCWAVDVREMTRRWIDSEEMV